MLRNVLIPSDDKSIMKRLSLFIVAGLVALLSLTACSGMVPEKPLTAILQEYPADGAENVPTNTLVFVRFVEGFELDAEILGLSAMQVSDVAGNLIAGTLSYDPSDRALYFTSSSPLEFEKEYLVTVKGGLESLSGFTLEEVEGDSYQWSFITTALQTAEFDPSVEVDVGVDPGSDSGSEPDPKPEPEPEPKPEPEPEPTPDPEPKPEPEVGCVDSNECTVGYTCAIPPEQTTGQCAPAICTSDADCAAGNVCSPWKLCFQEAVDPENSSVLYFSIIQSDYYAPLVIVEHHILDVPYGGVAIVGTEIPDAVAASFGPAPKEGGSGCVLAQAPSVEDKKLIYQYASFGEGCHTFQMNNQDKELQSFYKRELIQHNIGDSVGEKVLKFYEKFFFGSTEEEVQSSVVSLEKWYFANKQAMEAYFLKEEKLFSVFGIDLVLDQNGAPQAFDVIDITTQP